MHWLLPTPYFASGEAVGTTKETADSYSPLMHTRSKKFARGRCISADLGHTEELNGICAEKSFRERLMIDHIHPQEIPRGSLSLPQNHVRFEYHALPAQRRRFLNQPEPPE